MANRFSINKEDYIMGNIRTLLEPITIGGTKIKNRVILPSMSTCFGNLDGTPSRQLLAHYGERAKGGAGLMIMEAVDVLYPHQKQNITTLSLNGIQYYPHWKEITETVHAFGAKILAQLYRPGILANPAINQGEQPVCASEFNGAREITREEIQELKAAFLSNARAAAECGFDGVELHACHMYLLNNFLSPISNHRTDEYGGSDENRFRLLKEVLEEVRAALPRPFILSVRLATIDLVPGGIDETLGAKYAKWCEAAGADMLNISCGFYTKPYEGAETQWEPHAARLYMSRIAKQVCTIPVTAVGKLHDPEAIADLIENGEIDLACVGRPQLCDPQWVNKLQFGKREEIRPCMHCLEGCLSQHFYNNSIRCAINPYLGFEDLRTESGVTLAAEPKKIIVAGGGLAGMQFAIIAKRRGHDVTILEKSDALGGQMMLAGAPPVKGSMLRALDWFRAEVARRKIPVQLNTEATVETLSAMDPDIVVVAAGSVPNKPRIPGIEHAVDAWDMIRGDVTVPAGGQGVIIGGGTVGCEAAHMLIDQDSKAVILEMSGELCKAYDLFNKDKMVTFLNEHADARMHVRVTEILPNAVRYTDESGAEHEVEADKVIYAVGQHSVGSALWQAVRDAGMETYMIGDSNTPAKMRQATKAAYDLAYRV